MTHARSFRTRRPIVGLVVAAVALTVAGCGGSGGGGSVTLPSSVTRPTQAPTSASGGGGTSAPDQPTTEPKTEAPTEPKTEAPTEPATKPTSTVTQAPTTSPQPSTSNESLAWWAWILIGIAVIAIIVGVVLFTRRRKSPPWPDQVSGVLDESDQITTHVVGLAPAGFGSVASADAARLAGLMASVGRLVASAPDEPSRHALVSLQEPMRSLQAAVDGVALAGVPVTDAAAEDVRARATALHSATSIARAALVPPPPASGPVSR